jgi:hypothetical protein
VSRIEGGDRQHRHDAEDELAQRAAQLDLGAQNAQQALVLPDVLGMLPPQFDSMTDAIEL